MKSPKIFLLALLSAAGLFAMVAASVPRTPLRYPLLQTDMDGGGQCITNLGCLQVGSVSATTITTSNLFATNITAQTLNVSNVNVATINNNSFSTLCNVQLLEVFDMGTNAVLQAAGTNRYWMDMKHTNAMGQIDIYATLVPTNDVQIELPTNGFRGGLLSFNILARGADRVVFFPTNFAAFNTNDAGLVLAGSRYVGHLTSGNEYRFTIQSNVTYSLLSKSIGQ